MNSIDRDAIHYEDTPAYEALKKGGVLCTKYRRATIEDIFTGKDVRASSSQQANLQTRCLYGYYCCPLIGCALYKSSHVETFVPAGHVGFLMNEKNEYLFMQPGMHNIASWFLRESKSPTPLRGHIQHGNRTIVIVEQGYLGYAMDNGQPVLLPPGIHVWTSESLFFERDVALNDHIVTLGPMTIVTVDEGYAAVTQNNGRQAILQGGHTHLLTHKNWKFEKFLTLKIQTDELEKIQATSADNINMMVTSTVNWRIFDAEVAATMAAETMSVSGKRDAVSADISKLRRDVLKQALASLAAFIGSVNYSESFHMSAAAAGAGPKPVVGVEVVASGKQFVDNPMYDPEKMGTSVEHANKVTRTYGVEIMSINIISAAPVDDQLTRSLASGAVASAEALQAETAARGKANAVRIAAEAEAAQAKIQAQGRSDSDVIRAKGEAEAQRIAAEGDKAAEVLRSEGQAAGIRSISGALNEKGGSQAMSQRLAETYVGQLAGMARESKMIIVPDKPNDVSGVLATAMGLGKALSKVE